MAMRRENVAAALRYLQDKADLRGRFQRATSLDPQEQDLADIAVETGASFIPGVGPALAARDFERARRADDPTGMAMAGMGAIPGGRLVRMAEMAGGVKPQKIAQALETTLKNQNLVDVFNKTAKREIESINKRIVDPDEVHLTHQPITNLEDLDQRTDPIFNYAKASVLKKIGEQNGFNVKLEGSNVSPSVYAKFTKVNDDGLIDFKVRISDHADVSRNKPIGEKKAYDINPDSNGSMQEIIQSLNDPNWLKQFYELD